MNIVVIIVIAALAGTGLWCAWKADAIDRESRKG